MRLYRERGIRLFEIPDFEHQFTLFGKRMEWSTDTVRTRAQHFESHPLPITMGLSFAAAPYVIGGLGVAFAPPPFKPLFASMMVPTGVGELFWFGVGYGFGEQLEDWM